MFGFVLVPVSPEEDYESESGSASASPHAKTHRTRSERNMDTKTDDKGVDKCPIVHGTTNVGMRSNSDWWPNQLNLRILRQNSRQSDPMGKGFNYAEEFKKLDFQAVKKDLTALMTDRQDG